MVSPSAYDGTLMVEYILQVLNPAIKLVGLTALSQAFEKRLFKLNLVITLPGLLCRKLWQAVLQCILRGKNTLQSDSWAS